jgi:hypothetical protein
MDFPPHALFLDASFPRTRESRFVLRRISLDTRFRGYDGIQQTFSLCKPSSHRYFRRSARRTRRFRNNIIPNFVLFVSFVVNPVLS